MEKGAMKDKGTEISLTHVIRTSAVVSSIMGGLIGGIFGLLISNADRKNDEKMLIFSEKYKAFAELQESLWEFYTQPDEIVKFNEINGLDQKIQAKIEKAKPFGSAKTKQLLHQLAETIHMEHGQWRRETTEKKPGIKYGRTLQFLFEKDRLKSKFRDDLVKLKKSLSLDWGQEPDGVNSKLLPTLEDGWTFKNIKIISGSKVIADDGVEHQMFPLPGFATSGKIKDCGDGTICWVIGNDSN